MRATYLTVIVSPRPAKPAVSSNAVSLCQFQQTSALTASLTTGGASLVWYGTNATGGTGSSVAPQPSTANAGTFKYYVAQKLNDCEGDRAEITVEVKAASPAPTTSPVAYCPGVQASPLTAVAASGGTLNWYNSSSGGTASSVGPTPPTNTVGTQTYYVAQVVGNNCESQRMPLTVTINPTPAAPNTAGSSAVFCQYSQGQPLTATGQNLKWYDVSMGGTAAGTVTPNTATSGAKIYYVSQTVLNCESPRTAVTVNILAVPAPPTPTQTNYEFCQGTVAVISGTIAPGVAVNWYIYGTEPGLTNTYADGSTAYATISTEQARTLQYSLFQTAANGCKGNASPIISITVKPAPAPPVVQSVVVCQNATIPILSAVGESLRWYTSSTGGTGSATTPVVSTSQAGKLTYHVSQSRGGCESQRVALSVTVNAIPAAPTVASTGPVYCQNVAAVPLQATGLGLSWFREASGGISLGSTVTPDTKDAGSVTYYVSQTVDGCEGGRANLIVKVNPSPALPTATTAYSYCQRAPATSLTAQGNALRWYDANGRGRDTAPTPSTDNPGTVSYFVAQSAEGCESNRLEIKVTTKPIPGAPITSALSICQNDQTRALSAGGQGLLWYNAETGGTGSATTPTINTSQVGQANFYVSQSLDGCEGPRATLAVTVKSIPPAPGVEVRNVCQFANPESVTALGQNLTWYNPDGTKANTTPIINTAKGATFTYQVTQTTEGCEGPKATLTANVLTTPVPAVAKTVVELCQGATAQPLDAIGTNLIWTNPTGSTSTTAPVPPTVSPTRADGDTYYVTQTGANGCISDRAVIRVFIQTAPTLSVSGGMTVNLGVEMPLKLTFTGVGPYKYRLSDGTTGAATKDTTILVLPTQTTIYQVAEVTNKCGSGQVGSGTATTIAVRVPTIRTSTLTSTSLCVGSSLSTGFLTTGEFNSGSIFKLQIAKAETDTTKLSFADLPVSTTANGQISGVIPTTLAAGQYRVRVIATNPKIPINGTLSASVLTVRAIATATLTGNQTIFEGQTAKLSVALTGDAPWTFTYRDSTATGLGTEKQVQTTDSPYSLTVQPLKTTAYFLTSVGNACGPVSTARNLVVVNVALLLGIEDPLLAEAVEVYPIPANGTLTVRIRGLSVKETAKLQLTDQRGRTTGQYETRRETSVLSLEHQPAGVYILRIQVGDRTASKRIVKL